MTLIFCGLGLRPEDLPQSILFELQKADMILMDSYTNFPGGTFHSSSEVACHLTSILNHPVTVCSRSKLEEESEDVIAAARDKTVAILVPGDPFIATTHISLRQAAIRAGIAVRIHHNTSILSAAPSLSGLHAYKFGRVATMTFRDNPSRYLYETVCANLMIDAHSLIIHDLDVSSGRFVTVKDSLQYLLVMEEESHRSRGLVSAETPVLGLCRVGAPNSLVRAGRLSGVMQYDWVGAGPPQCTILCASLHPTELEALRALWPAQM